MLFVVDVWVWMLVGEEKSGLSDCYMVEFSVEVEKKLYIKNFY